LGARVGWRWRLVWDDVAQLCLEASGVCLCGPCLRRRLRMACRLCPPPRIGEVRGRALRGGHQAVTSRGSAAVPIARRAGGSRKKKTRKAAPCTHTRCRYPSESDPAHASAPHWRLTNRRSIKPRGQGPIHRPRRSITITTSTPPRSLPDNLHTLSSLPLAPMPVGGYSCTAADAVDDDGGGGGGGGGGDGPPAGSPPSVGTWAPSTACSRAAKSSSAWRSGAQRARQPTTKKTIGTTKTTDMQKERPGKEKQQVRNADQTLVEDRPAISTAPDHVRGRLGHCHTRPRHAMGQHPRPRPHQTYASLQRLVLYRRPLVWNRRRGDLERLAERPPAEGQRLPAAAAPPL